MSSENKTPNIGLNQWQGHEYVRREDFASDNLIIDREIKDLQDEKLDKVSGKGLSTNDYTDEEKNKLSSLEEEIKAPAYTPPIHNYSNIFSAGEGYADDGSVLDYSESVVNGQVSVGVKGRSYTQIEEDGRALCNDVSKFTHNFGAPILTQNSGHINVEYNTGQSYCILGWDVNTYLSPLEYVFVKADVELVSGMSLMLDLSNYVKSILLTEQKRSILYLKFHVPSDISGNFGWWRFVLSGVAGDSFKVYKISQYRITEDEYNNLSEDELNERYGFHLHGTNSTVCAIRGKATGKNIINPLTDYVRGLFVNGMNGRIQYVSDTKSVISRIIGGETYQVYRSSDSDRNQYAFCDVYPHSELPSLSYGYTTNGLVTAPKNAKYIIYYVANVGTNKPSKVMIARTDTLIPYEPYKSDKTYISCTDDDGNIEELRSLPNGVKDEISDGKLHKNTGKEENLNGKSGTWVFDREFTNTIRVKKTLSELGIADAKNVVDNNTVWASRLIISGVNFKSTDAVSVYSNDEECVSVDINRQLVIRINKNRPSSLDNAGMESFLSANNHSLTYQLATPIVTPIKNINPLKFWKKGTIEISPYLRKSIKYTNGKLTFPIAVSNIDKIVDRNNFEVLQSDINLSNDGLSAQITNAAEGEVYTVYAPIKSELSAISETVMSFPMNTKAQIESNCKGVQQLGNNFLTLQDTMAMFIVKNA